MGLFICTIYLYIFPLFASLPFCEQMSVASEVMLSREYNPVFGCIGSPEVDIFVIYHSKPLSLETLKVSCYLHLSFVALSLQNY